MNEILLKVQQYLANSNDGPVNMPEDLIEEFGNACKAALRRQFTEPKRDKFTLRMSNVGRPLCQLQMEAAGTKGEVRGYNMRMVSLFGDLIEAAAIAILQASGNPIKEKFTRVSLPIGETRIDGTFDVLMESDDSVYDVKSCSKYQWDTKYGPGTSFERLLEGDDFGYVGQGYGYAKARGKRFAGWIVINKNSGEWNIVGAPSPETLPYDVIKKIEENVNAILSGKPFERCFTDVAETYYSKPTGNRVLGSTCGFCEFKSACWPEVKALPQLPSKGANRKLMYYTKIDPKWETKDEVHTDAEDSAPRA